MENLNEATLSFATLMSPAFIAYLLHRKIKNKEVNISISLPVIISLITLNFIILGIVNIQLFVVNLFSDIINHFISITSTKLRIIIIILLVFLILYLLKKSNKNGKLASKYFFTLSGLIIILYLIMISQDKWIMFSLLDPKTSLIEVEFSNEKIFINPLAIIIHSFYGLILIHIVEIKIIPFLKEIFVGDYSYLKKYPKSFSKPRNLYSANKRSNSNEKYR